MQAYVYPFLFYDAQWPLNRVYNIKIDYSWTILKSADMQA